MGWWRFETNALRSFARLRSGERKLLLRAVAEVAAARVRLWVLPFRRLGLGSEDGQRSPAPGAAAELEAVSRAVDRAARVVPHATCLVRALAARRLLHAAGISSQVRLGVAVGEDGAFRAHAWLESGGRVVVGGRGMERFQPLPADAVLSRLR